MPLSEVLREGKYARTGRRAQLSMLLGQAGAWHHYREACPQTEPGSADSQPVGRPGGGDRS